jgi:iron complex outermembrane recepter protein
MPGAAVDVKNVATSAEHKVTADSQGQYSVGGLTAGRYSVQVTVSGFALSRKEVQLADGQTEDVPVMLALAAAMDQVTIETANAGSIAAQYAPMDTPLDTRTARTEISNVFITNFTSPLADFSEVIQMAPGAFSVNSNGIGLGDSKTYFRGFSDGNYDITFDGIPFEDTNSPTHHSWAFFPSQWIGGVDFDRSPGSASTVGPTPFGGSINLLSRETPVDQNIRFGVSYGSFNTLLYDGHYDSGNFGPGHKSNVLVDVHHLTSDGYQTFNFQTRNAGSLKYQYKFSETSVLTGFSGVVWLDSNTPNIKGPTRTQIATFGDNYLLQNTDPTQANYYKYNFYHVPTDFEYIGYRTDLGKSWHLDTKPYTYSYYNQQNYATQPSTGNINPVNCNPTKAGSIRPCATDKLNSYRKYGEITTLSKVSKFGVGRVGMWYEWATTSRHQIPQDPLTLVDDVLPNFNEQFWTTSYQPFAEYEFHPGRNLTITGGFKYAHYNMDLKQYADNGKTIGSVDPITKQPFVFVTHSAGYNSYMPSADVNYRIKTNWSAYAQFATGSVIPPSSVFDVTGAVVSTTPKPTTAKTYQGGTVVKLKRATFNADLYYTRFQNAYTSSPDPNATSATQYQQSGDTVTKGFEGETNLYLVKGLSLYLNGTAGTARYVSQIVTGAVNPNYGVWLANTPANTESYGLTYQQKYIDLGFFNKRVGTMWQDNTATYTVPAGYNGCVPTAPATTCASSITASQVAPVDPFNVTNAFLNYTVRNGGRFDQTKFRLSINNLFDQHNITSLTPAGKSVVTPTVSAVNSFVPAGGDTLGLLPGRSFTLSVTFGYAPKR